MKKHILSFFSLILLLTGCTTNQAVTNKTTSPNITNDASKNTSTEIQQPKINNSQTIDEKLENKTTSTTTNENLNKEVVMLTYSNKANNFSINYPKSWTFKEGKEFDYAFHIFFSSGVAQFGILPQGELDRGLPQNKPDEKKISIDGKSAIEKNWKLENGNILRIINFLDFPKTWNKNNRIEITGQQKDIEMFDKMLESFKFVE
ncbi:MAG: hypothetical protein V1892_01410 [bacterium]